MGSRTGKRLQEKSSFPVFLRWYYPVQVRRVYSQPSRSDESERDAPLTEQTRSRVEKNCFNIQLRPVFVKSIASDALRIAVEVSLAGRRPFHCLACHSFFVYFLQR